ncbi:MAG: primosomal protein N' [Anaerolineae bacterium]|nr:primosomal protein N' [Anaerolineae bacterium]
MYAEVVVSLPVEDVFHYHIPADLAGRLEVGHLVEVQFGAQKTQGVIVGFTLQPAVKDTRPILRLVDRNPVVLQSHLALAQWLSETYLAPLSDCLRLFIPPGVSKRGDMQILPVIDPMQIEAATGTQTHLLKLLARRGPLRGRQIARSMPRRDWQEAVRQLADRGLLLREPVLDPPSIHPKRVRVVEMAVPPEKIGSVVVQLFEGLTPGSTRHNAAERRTAILRMLAQTREPVEVGQIYTAVPGSKLSDLRMLAEDDWVILREEEAWRDPLEDVTFVPDVPPRLTFDQQAAWEEIEQALKPDMQSEPILLHGVTGSGKTELYLRAVACVLKQGRSAIVLVPEIALTPQTVRRFGARFSGRMGLIHSQLSDGERYDTWRRARSGQYDVIVGPRSALFAPLQNLGLIVIDECHDDSYKQSPPITPPYYHTLPTAIELARLQGGLVIMGSATPDIVTYAQGARDEFRLLSLPARIMGHRRAIELQAVHFHINQTHYSHLPEDPDEAVMIDLPPVQVVDMRRELQSGNRTIFSRALTDALADTLRQDQQAILFLNRRGTATYVFCRTCGHVLLCPRCDIPLTWHTYQAGQQAEQGFLVCHQCNHRTQHPKVCPACGSEHIRFFGGGTERVEQDVLTHFPEARVLRWDRDTTSDKGAHTLILQRFANHQANVLIGTQMIAKGLDLPMVTLVGVISADTALYLPDYRSGERTFQLLTQVAGRAGRGLLGGKVILQTYAPEHYAIEAAAEHNFHAFYTQEMTHRRELGYPPFIRLVRLIVRAESAQRTQVEAERLFTLLSERIANGKFSNTSLIGPAPCFYPRREGLYRWHILVRGPAPSVLLADLRPSQNLQIDVDPVSVL